MSERPADRPFSPELTLVCASANPDKVAEIHSILSDAAPWIELRPRPTDLGDVVEDAPDLEGNARLKAVAVCEATGMPAVADDTGLEVDALGGRPGVHSARYSGAGATYESNVAKLLAELDRVGARTDRQRRARFRTVALVRWPDDREIVAEGTVAGHISVRPSGSEGFGYDPVFVPDRTDGGAGPTFGEMSIEEKDEISHRRRAFAALADALAADQAG